MSLYQALGECYSKACNLLLGTKAVLANTHLQYSYLRPYDPVFSREALKIAGRSLGRLYTHNGTDWVFEAQCVLLDENTVVTARHSCCVDADSGVSPLLVSWLDRDHVEHGCLATLISDSQHKDVAKLSLSCSNQSFICMQKRSLMPEDLGRQCAFVGFDLARDLAVRNERKLRSDTPSSSHLSQLPDLPIILFGHVSAVDHTPRRFRDGTMRWFFSARASYANKSGLSGGAVVHFDKSTGEFVLMGIHIAGEYLNHRSKSINFSGTLIGNDMKEGTFPDNRKRGFSVESASMSDDSLDSYHLLTPEKRTVDLIESSVMPIRYCGVTGRSIFVSIECLNEIDVGVRHIPKRQRKIGLQSFQMDQLLYDDGLVPV